MEFHGIATGLAIILGGMAVSILLVLLARGLFTEDETRQARDITGNLLSVVGTLYAVLLGLIVVDVMVRFERAVDNVQEESNSLADIFLLAARLPEPFRRDLQDTCRTYARQLVDDEWPRLARAQPSPSARRTAFALTQCLAAFEPRSEAEKAVYPLLLEQVREVWDCRRERVGTAEYGIPAVAWFVLVVGGVVTVLLSGLLRTESHRLQIFLTALAALLIGLNLYLIALFGYPFAGDLTVSSRPFEVDIELFDARSDRDQAEPAG